MLQNFSKINKIMTNLSVNINKVAIIRNSRGGNFPDVCKIAEYCQMYGGDGITVHPRPDERHITYNDVHELRPLVSTEFNIEGHPSASFLDLVTQVKPEQVTLVPDSPDALTSNAGWDTKTNEALLKEVITTLHDANIRTSIFIEPEPELLDYALKTNTDRVEFYTEPYARHYKKNRQEAVAPFQKAAHKAKDMGMELNAGHDLNLKNLRYLSEKIPFLKEVSIGHALISDALFYGLKDTIQLYKSLLVK